LLGTEELRREAEGKERIEKKEDKSIEKKESTKADASPSTAKDDTNSKDPKQEMKDKKQTIAQKKQDLYPEVKDFVGGDQNLEKVVTFIQAVSVAAVGIFWSMSLGQ